MRKALVRQLTGRIAVFARRKDGKLAALADYVAGDDFAAAMCRLKKHDRHVVWSAVLAAWKKCESREPILLTGPASKRMKWTEYARARLIRLDAKHPFTRIGHLAIARAMGLTENQVMLARHRFCKRPGRRAEAELRQAA